MRTGIVALALVAASGAWAQEEERPAEERRGSGLTGTPQKPGVKKSAPAPKRGEEPKDPEEAARPSEHELFGTSGAQTPEPEKTPDRPAEEDLFGTEPPAASAAEKVREGGEDEEAQRLAPGIVDRFAGGEEDEDPLDIGGLFYQRLAATALQGESFGGAALTAPTLVDAYFDARPSDRLRAMIVARMLYNPSLPSQSSAPAGLAGVAGSEGTGSTTSTLSSLFRPAANPSIALDQLWLRFDIARAVFVTLGKQHVKWGAGRFWNPTDFLHPVRRDALALFDARTGVNMAKLHVPLEASGANFYGIALFDNFGNADRLGQVGGAFRAEIVLGDAEVGADAVVQRGQRPRYGADLSSALGPFDVYGEVALRSGPYNLIRVEEFPADPDDSLKLPQFLVTQEPHGDYALAATLGLSWTFAWSDNDTATVGAEYFYNPTGYDDPALYPYLLVAGAFQPFYVGRHYAGAFALVAGPGSWDKTSFVLSTLGNLSDRSFVSRLDFTVRVLTHLTVEANASVFYGSRDGEFRLGLDITPRVVNGFRIEEPIESPAQSFQLGLGLRLDI